MRMLKKIERFSRNYSLFSQSEPELPWRQCFKIIKRKTP